MRNFANRPKELTSIVIAQLNTPQSVLKVYVVDQSQLQHLKILVQNMQNWLFCCHFGVCQDSFDVAAILNRVDSKM